MITNPRTAATPLNLDLNARNALTWNYHVGLVGTAPHSVIVADDFTAPAGNYFGSNTEANLVRGFGHMAWTSSAENPLLILVWRGRYAGPAWIASATVERMDSAPGGVNVIDVGVGIPGSFIGARLWRTESRCDVSVSIDWAGAVVDYGDQVTTAIAFPSAPFALALLMNGRSFAVGIGEPGGANMRPVTPWYAVTNLDFASDTLRIGTDGDGGCTFSLRCQTTTPGIVYGFQRVDWRYWDGVGTRETYLLSDIDGSPIVEDGKVWMTTDRTLPTAPGVDILAASAQMIVCQYDPSPSSGRLGPETARFFYRADDGKIYVAQNAKIVWDRAENVFHCYIPDWGKSPGHVRMLYARVDYADLRHGVHVLAPVPLVLPTGPHFDPAPEDFIFDASMIRRPDGVHLFLVTWVDQSRGYPLYYTRALFSGTAPDTFTQIVGWDDSHPGEGHRIVLSGGKTLVICGGTDVAMHVWEIDDTQPNWLAYQGSREIPALDVGAGVGTHYPQQPELFGLPSKGGMVYHLTGFGPGQFDPAMNATQGSFWSARSQEFPKI